MHRLTALRWPLVGRASELDRLGEIALASSRGGVVIAGPAGVGKTRLAREVLEMAARHGLETATASASESAATIPLGALSPLLPPMPHHRAPAELLRQARAAIAERGRGGRLALLVDDAHRLDDMSATVVCQLASGGDAFVIATVRSEAQAPDAVVALWKDEIAERVELRPLPVSSVEDPLNTVLGGNIDAGTLRRFTEVSGGNPMFLRELVLAACENQLLQKENGLWRLVGPLAVSSRLVEIVTARLTRLEAPERAALEHGQSDGQRRELEARGGNDRRTARCPAGAVHRPAVAGAAPLRPRLLRPRETLRDQVLALRAVRHGSR